MIKELSKATQGHLAEQQPALPVFFVPILMAIATPLDTPLAILAAIVLRVVCSTLRFGHTCRASRSSADCAARIEVWTISRGKGRARESFKVALPTHLAPDLPLFSSLQSKLQFLLPDQADNYFCPDICVGSLGLSAHFDFVAADMPAARFTAVMRSFLMESIGLTKLAALSFSTRSSRRYLATVADGLNLPPESKDALGNWRDVANTGMPKQRVVELMHVRYSALRLESSAAVRRLCLSALVHLHKNKPEASFEDLSRVVPHIPTYERHAASASWGSASSTSGELVPAPSSPGSKVEPEATQELSLPMFEASDSEDASSEPEPDELAVQEDQLVWITPKGLRGLIHLASADLESEVNGPRCTGAHFKEGFTCERGLESSLSLSKTWCPSCCARLPPSLAHKCYR